jgi:glycerophosphoryl diester phosphodiesterase
VTGQVVLVAHRGLAASWPENTLLALEAAVDAGARWVEVDVQLCADGTPVLLHDADLARVAGRAVQVFDLDAAQLAAIPVGEPARFGERFSQARAPTLAEFARWLASRPGVRAFVELKPESLARFGRPAVVQACHDAMAGAPGQWAPISYDDEALALAGDAGAAELGWIVRGFDASVASRAAELPARWLFCNHQRIPPGPLPRGSWDWVLYEIADPASARDLLARGARWLETMDVAGLASGLAKQAPT